MMNIISQAINWSITVAYFITPIAAWMGRAAEVRMKSRYYQGLLNQWSALMADEDACLFADHGKQNMENVKKVRERMQETKNGIREDIIARVGLAFLGEDSGEKQKQMGEANAENAGQLLTQWRFRDGDIRVLIELLRDQAISAIEMNKPI